MAEEDTSLLRPGHRKSKGALDRLSAALNLGHRKTGSFPPDFELSVGAEHAATYKDTDDSPVYYMASPIATSAPGPAVAAAAASGAGHGLDSVVSGISQLSGESDGAIRYIDVEVDLDTAEVFCTSALPLHRRLEEHRRLNRARLSTWKVWRYNIARRWKHFKNSLWDRFGSTGIWAGRIRRIESLRGTVVASFFNLLSFLFTLNLMTSLIVFLVVMLPHGFSSPWVAPCSFAAENLVFANGCLEHSFLFEGHYGPMSYYNMPVAYSLVFVLLCVFIIGCLLAGMARDYAKGHVLKYSADRPFSLAALMEFDMTYTTSEAMARQKGLIRTRVLELLTEHSQVNIVAEPTKLQVVLRGLLIHSTVAAILAGALYGVFSLAQRSAGTADGVESLYSPMLLASFNVLLPTVFEKLGEHELIESPRIRLRLNLLRSFVLRIAGVYVVVISAIPQTKTIDGDTCWETAMGQVLYRVLLVDTVAFVCSTVISDGLRSYLNSRVSFLNRIFGPPTFDLPRNVLCVIYRQALLWVGMFFSPALPAIATALCVPIFFVVEFTTLRFLHLPAQLFHIASASTFYIQLLLAAFFFAVGHAVYVVLQKTPSLACSPFRNMTSVIDPMSDVIESMDTGAQSVVKFLCSPPFVVSLLALVITVLLHYRSLCKALNRFIVENAINLAREQEYAARASMSAEQAAAAHG
eukprot:m.101817 g.101817  ORF g.101817 m.101817 type:complete len:693 (-) comp14099_c2_seq2:25-2103(-)